jgi:hypothetical protein
LHSGEGDRPQDNPPEQSRSKEKERGGLVDRRACPESNLTTPWADRVRVTDRRGRVKGNQAAGRRGDPDARGEQTGRKELARTPQSMDLAVILLATARRGSIMRPVSDRGVTKPGSERTSSGALAGILAPSHRRLRREANSALPCAIRHRLTVQLRPNSEHYATGGACHGVLAGRWSNVSRRRDCRRHGTGVAAGAVPRRAT